MNLKEKPKAGHSADDVAGDEEDEGKGIDTDAELIDALVYFSTNLIRWRIQFDCSDKHDSQLIGKKQDKLGRWRTAKVPDDPNDPVHAYAIDERVKHLGRSERYIEELSRISKAKNLPHERATPEQRSRAALKALGK